MLGFASGIQPVVAHAEDAGTIRFLIQDKDQKLTPCRIHLSNSQGRAIRATGLPFWNDHFVCSGATSVDVAPGPFRWSIERGPEYVRRSGTLSVESGETTTVNVPLDRIANLVAERWYSADLHTHRPAADIDQFPGPTGNGFWTQQIDYHILNCGIFLPPTAGSESGV